jgi:hypothetical protein
VVDRSEHLPRHAELSLGLAVIAKENIGGGRPLDLESGRTGDRVRQ